MKGNSQLNPEMLHFVRNRVELSWESYIYVRWMGSFLDIPPAVPVPGNETRDHTGMTAGSAHLEGEKCKKRNINVEMV